MVLLKSATDRLLEVFGACLLLGGIAFTFNCFHKPIDSYDEGLILTDSNLLLMGEVPYRDFYSNYPPGIFLLVAGIWKIIGISVHSERAVGLAIHIGIAIASGMLAGRMAGRRFSFLAAGLVSVWTNVLSAIPYAWLAGLF